MERQLHFTSACNDICQKVIQFQLASSSQEKLGLYHDFNALCVTSQDMNLVPPPPFVYMWQLIDSSFVENPDMTIENLPWESIKLALSGYHFPLRQSLPHDPNPIAEHSKQLEMRARSSREPSNNKSDLAPTSAYTNVEILPPLVVNPRGSLANSPRSPLSLKKRTNVAVLGQEVEAGNPKRRRVVPSNKDEDSINESGGESGADTTTKSEKKPRRNQNTRAHQSSGKKREMTVLRLEPLVFPDKCPGCLRLGVVCQSTVETRTACDSCWATKTACMHSKKKTTRVANQQSRIARRLEEERARLIARAGRPGEEVPATTHATFDDGLVGAIEGVESVVLKNPNADSISASYGVQISEHQQGPQTQDTLIAFLRDQLVEQNAMIASLETEIHMLRKSINKDKEITIGRGPVSSQQTDFPRTQMHSTDTDSQLLFNHSCGIEQSTEGSTVTESSMPAQCNEEIVLRRNRNSSKIDIEEFVRDSGSINNQNTGVQPDPDEPTHDPLGRSTPFFHTFGGSGKGLLGRDLQPGYHPITPESRSPHIPVSERYELDSPRLPPMPLRVLTRSQSGDLGEEKESDSDSSSLGDGTATESTSSSRFAACFAIGTPQIIGYATHDALEEARRTIQGIQIDQKI